MKAGTGLILFSIAFFVVVFQSRIPEHRMVLPTFRVGLPSSIQPPWKYSHRQTHSYASLVIINADKLTMKSDHHTS